MVARGVKQLLVKRLAPNDNSKNQPYVARGDLEAVNILPAGKFRVERTDHGNETLKAYIEFYWLQPDGGLSRAPRTQLILYPQYPEIRLSGFLAGAKNAPNHLLNTREEGRLLLLGVTDDRRIIAWATDSKSAISRAIHSQRNLEKLGVFLVLPLLETRENISSREILVAELRRISALDWIRSKSLRRDGSVVECSSQHCVGYTLEAEFGVARNGVSDPDFQGWELKATTVTSLNDRPSSKAVTLMTPEPTGGYYRSEGVSAFIRKFGYFDKKGRVDRLNFGGVHKFGAIHPTTQLTLQISGFDHDKGRMVDPSGAIALVSKKGVVAAEWSFASLMSHWNRKHAKAAYIPAEARVIPQRAYRYGGRVRLAQGTDFNKLLKALARGAVYYDPGIKLENASSESARTKQRSQFRIKSIQLGELYAAMEEIVVS